tara:strand:- start:853 stop:1935 length:1083 start_codon:yes stop_codon:yes gene_type:complete
MKTTALTDIHIEMGAKMVPFAGYKMPVHYKGVIAEHLNVRNKVGVFDVSHMGEFFVEGPYAMDLIQKLTTNDISVLNDGQVQYTCMPNLSGGIVDDLLIYKFNQEKYMLVVNASNIQKDLNWIIKFNFKNAKISNFSDKYSMLAIQGPMSSQALQPLTSFDLLSLKYYNFVVHKFCGFNNVIISATGYTGSGGYEIYFPNDYAKTIWKSILESGNKFGIQPIGLAARDTLRLEMGFCLYGNDINDDTSPIEAGLSWITKFNNSFNYSKELQLQKENGVQRKRVGFEILDRGIARNGYTILNENDEEIGFVTSGTMSPSLQKSIGMGYVNSEYAKSDTKLYIQIRNKKIKALVVKLPFYKS